MTSEKIFSFTVVILAYNEEKNIAKAIRNVEIISKKFTKDYDILVYDDGSKDNTYYVAQKLAKKNRRIQIIRNRYNLGLGHSLRDAIKRARKTYLTVFPGDSDMSAKSLEDLLITVPNYDLVLSYPKYSKKRPFIRKLISNCYIRLMNFLFGLNLKYYTGPWISKVSILRKIPILSDGFSVFAEIKVRLIKRNYSYKEIPFEYVGRKFGESKAFRWRNITQVFYTLGVLFKNKI